MGGQEEKGKGKNVRHPTLMPLGKKFPPRYAQPLISQKKKRREKMNQRLPGSSHRLTGEKGLLGGGNILTREWPTSSSGWAQSETYRGRKKDRLERGGNKRTQGKTIRKENDPNYVPTS